MSLPNLNNPPSFATYRYPEDMRSVAYVNFIERYPEYTRTSSLDELRRREYSRLDRTGNIYLDYTGGGLYAESQVNQHMELLTNQVFGNPHSHNPTSLAMTKLVESARRFVLEYFQAPPDEFTAIFTSNASGALKLVGESYPFTRGGCYALAFDNHNSVNGIREFARARDADIHYIPVIAPDLHLDRSALEKILDQADPALHNLFAYPAQSNFSGAQHPLDLIPYARQRGWDILLDCAAYAPTNRLDIGAIRPDFATFSFYKMFGYPTGLGCLLARRDKLALLRRPWFAGGTITIASVQGNGYYLIDGEAAFEDGTVDYLNIPAVETGLRFLQQVGIDQIHQRVVCLTGWLIDELTGLRHTNGRPMVRIHGPVSTQERGSTVTISLDDPFGTTLDDLRIEELANHDGISLRTGCFCNPGAGEIAHGLSALEMSTFFQSGEKISFLELRHIMQARFSKYVSAIRISTGIASNFNDIYAFLRFVSRFLDQPAEAVGSASYSQASSTPKRDSA